MQNFKEKLYNYEAEPPAEIWQNINAELDDSVTKSGLMTGLRKRSGLVFYGITAAASLIIIFLISLFFNISRKNQNTGLNSANQSQNFLPKQVQDSLNLNNEILKEIINSTKDKNLLALNYENSSANGKKYLTIAGPECEPVKISPKVATLIESTDNEYPPKPVWNKKIEKWKQIMLGSTLSPSLTNLLDIVQLSSANDTNE
jgi:hypothetical protein